MPAGPAPRVLDCAWRQGASIESTILFGAHDLFKFDQAIDLEHVELTMVMVEQGSTREDDGDEGAPQGVCRRACTGVG